MTRYRILLMASVDLIFAFYADQLFGTARYSENRFDECTHGTFDVLDQVDAAGLVVSPALKV